MPSSKIELLIQRTNLCDYNKINLSIDYINAGNISVAVVSVLRNQSMFPARKKTRDEEIPFSSDLYTWSCCCDLSLSYDNEPI